MFLQFALALALLGALQVARPTNHRQDAAAILASSARIEPHERADISEAFGQVMNTVRVPGGIASKAGCDAEATAVLHAQEAPLGQLLNSLITSYPSYRWELSGGVVNVAPTAGFPSLLDTKLSSLQIDDQMATSMLLQRVFESPEVQARSRELKLHLGRIEPGFGSVKKPGTPPAKEKATAAQTLHNVTAREALNAIVRLRGKGVWSYRERRCGKEEGVFNVSMIVN